MPRLIFILAILHSLCIRANGSGIDGWAALPRGAMGLSAVYDCGIS